MLGVATLVATIYLTALPAVGQAAGCVNTSCTVSCNTSLTQPCCDKVGRCEWDPVFADCEWNIPMPCGLFDTNRF
jgi:hypothetical protein